MHLRLWAYLEKDSPTTVKEVKHTNLVSRKDYSERSCGEKGFGYTPLLKYKSKIDVPTEAKAQAARLDPFRTCSWGAVFCQARLWIATHPGQLTAMVVNIGKTICVPLSPFLLRQGSI